MHLHAAVLADRHCQLLQRFVPAVRTENFVHVAGCSEIKNTFTDQPTFQQRNLKPEARADTSVNVPGPQRKNPFDAYDPKHHILAPLLLRFKEQQNCQYDVYLRPLGGANSLSCSF